MTIYSTRDAYDLYVYYLALKRHFTTDGYDFFKYHGKMKASQQSFETRKDKFFFYKLAKRKDAKEFILANMIHNPNSWIGDLLDGGKAEEVYVEWMKRQQSLSYMFNKDLGELEEDFNSNLIVKEGQHPRLLRLFHMKRIGIETLIIIDDLVNVFSYWNSRIDDPIIFPQIRRTIEKVRPFVQYERPKMKSILLTKFSE